MISRTLKLKIKDVLPGVVGGLALLSFGFFMHYLNQADALQANSFNPGNIMTDEVMADYQTMSAQEIQDFLNSKVANCDTTGQGLSPYGGSDLNGDGRVQRWEYAKGKSGETSFTCIKDYREADGRSAAEMIYEKAQKYKINPRVLIVLLQKEQGLILDDWPMNIQYRSATGYGCPDTAACDSRYYGLDNQLDWAAKMFRAILNRSSSWYTSYRVGVNNILWHPNAARCGSSQVNIENLATVALYSYTPYRPNQAALNAGWGSGDACSSYGNRNFYLYFRNWFGLTTNVAPKAISNPIVQSEAGTEYQYEIITTDPEGDHTAFALEKAPSWLRMTGNLLHGNVPSTASGNYDIEIKVYDYLGHTKHKFTLQVVSQVPKVVETNAKIDFNKDGYSDIAITSAFADGKTFNLWVFPGGKDGFAAPLFQRTFYSEHGWNQAKTKFFAGDANGDGFGDLTMLIEKADGGIDVKQVRGSTNFLSDAPLTLNNYGLEAREGWVWRYIDSIQSPADFNKDGYSDIAITSAFADGKTFNLWVFPGGKDGFAAPLFQRTFYSEHGWNQAKTKFFAGAGDSDKYGDMTMLIEKADGGIDVKQVRGSTNFLSDAPLTLNNYGLEAVHNWYWKYVDPVR